MSLKTLTPSLSNTSTGAVSDLQSSLSRSSALSSASHSPLSALFTLSTIATASACSTPNAAHGRLNSNTSKANERTCPAALSTATGAACVSPGSANVHSSGALGVYLKRGVNSPMRVLSQQRRSLSIQERVTVPNKAESVDSDSLAKGMMRTPASLSPSLTFQSSLASRVSNASAVTVLCPPKRHTKNASDEQASSAVSKEPRIDNQTHKRTPSEKDLLITTPNLRCTATRERCYVATGKATETSAPSASPFPAHSPDRSKSKRRRDYDSPTETDYKADKYQNEIGSGKEMHKRLRISKHTSDSDSSSRMSSPSLSLQPRTLQSLSASNGALSSSVISGCRRPSAVVMDLSEELTPLARDGLSDTECTPLPAVSHTANPEKQKKSMLNYGVSPVPHMSNTFADHARASPHCFTMQLSTIPSAGSAVSNDVAASSSASLFPSWTPYIRDLYAHHSLHLSQLPVALLNLDSTFQQINSAAKSAFYQHSMLQMLESSKGPQTSEHQVSNGSMDQNSATINDQNSTSGKKLDERKRRIALFSLFEETATVEIFRAMSAMIDGKMAVYEFEKPMKASDNITNQPNQKATRATSPTSAPTPKSASDTIQDSTLLQSPPRVGQLCHFVLCLVRHCHIAVRHPGDFFVDDEQERRINLQTEAANDVANDFHFPATAAAIAEVCALTFDQQNKVASQSDVERYEGATKSPAGDCPAPSSADAAATTADNDQQPVAFILFVFPLPADFQNRQPKANENETAQQFLPFKELVPHAPFAQFYPHMSNYYPLPYSRQSTATTPLPMHVPVSMPGTMPIGVHRSVGMCAPESFSPIGVAMPAVPIGMPMSMQMPMTMPMGLSVPMPVPVSVPQAEGFVDYSLMGVGGMDTASLSGALPMSLSRPPHLGMPYEYGCMSMPMPMPMAASMQVPVPISASPGSHVQLMRLPLPLSLPLSRQHMMTPSF